MSQATTALKLKEPITFGSETISTLVFHRPKAKHFRTFPMEPKFGDVLDLMGKLCGQPTPVMDELSIADLTEVAKLFEGFIPAGLATGKGRSA